MVSLLLLNLRTHLRYFARSRLLLAMVLALALIIGLPMTISLFFETASGKFDVVQSIDEALRGFTFLISSVLGLMLVSSHLRSRSLKVVLTKPCPVGIWMASAFLATTLVSLLFHLGVLLVDACLMPFFGLPIQPGIYYLVLRSLLISLAVLAYLLFLGTLMHPVAAVLVALLLNESTFYGLWFMVAAGVESGDYSRLMAPGRFLVRALYTALPVFSPYSEEYDEVSRSWLLPTGAIHHMVSYGVYVAALVSLFHLLSVLVLRRRRYV